MNGDEWRACGQGGAESLPGRAEETRPHYDGVVHERYRGPPDSDGREKRAAVLVLMAVLVVTTCPAEAGLGSRHIDPAQVVPLASDRADRRDVVAEVIRDHTFHRQGDSDAFPCPSSLYLSLRQ